MTSKCLFMFMKPKLRDLKTIQHNLDFYTPDGLVNIHRIASHSMIACFLRFEEI